MALPVTAYSSMISQHFTRQRIQDRLQQSATLYALTDVSLYAYLGFYRQIWPLLHFGWVARVWRPFQKPVFRLMLLISAALMARLFHTLNIEPETES